MDSEVRKNNLQFINEIGLDPGIDHLATMSTIQHIKSQNGVIKEYYSFTGGLVTPECCDNPLGYKFSWSPIGVFKALMGSAFYMKNRKFVRVPSEELMHSSEQISANKAQNLVGYPNRDSTTYQKLYGLEDIDTFVRGTLRYEGFCEIVGAWLDLGFITEKVAIPSDMKNWWEVLLWLSKDKESGANYREEFDENTVKMINNIASRNNLDNVKLSNICRKVINKNWQKYGKKGKIERLRMVLEGFEWFGMFNPDKNLPEPNPKSPSVFDSLCTYLQGKLALRDGENDLIVMIHFFKVIYPQKNTIEVIKSSMVKSGGQHGLSAMALTVGTPVAIAVKLILEKKIVCTGVQRPVIPEIYGPVGDELKKMGIFCKEEVVKSTDILPRL